MGYRLRLGRISKSNVESLRNLSLEEARKKGEESDWDWSPYRPNEHQQLYEMGKYVDYSEDVEDFYLNFDVKEEFESEFHIMSKEGLLKIIESYHDDIFGYYNDLLERAGNILVHKTGTEEDQEKFKGDIISHLHAMKGEWDRKFRIKPYRLEEKPDGEGWDGEISGSWKKEYAIFNLAHIYRTFDWENDYLIYSGW